MSADFSTHKLKTNNQRVYIMTKNEFIDALLFSAFIIIPFTIYWS